MLWILYILFIAGCLILSFVEDYNKNRFYKETRIGARLLLDDGTNFNVYSTETIVGSGIDADIRITDKNCPSAKNVERKQFALMLKSDGYYIMNYSQNSRMLIERYGTIIEVKKNEKKYVEDQDKISFVGSNCKLSMTIDLQGENNYD